MSYCPTAIVAAKIAVAAPTQVTAFCAAGTSTNNACERATRYTPAVTIVAAWISAETGVGPAMASGSHTYSGICADLPVTPSSMNSVIASTTHGAAAATCGACAKMTAKSKLLKFQNRKNNASSRPKSPMRLTTKAFLAACALPMPSLPFSNQKPINR